MCAASLVVRRFSSQLVREQLDSRKGDPRVFVSVHSARVEVLCFDTVLQVFIVNALARVFLAVSAAANGAPRLVRVLDKL
jgi:hypothetical protein